jgi:hypothetical protein
MASRGSLPNRGRHGQIEKRNVTLPNTSRNGNSAPSRPVALTVRPESIPVELRAIPQWVTWRYEVPEDRDGWTKIPYKLKNRKASSTDPTTWRTFEDTLAAYRAGGWDGIGLIHLPDNHLTGIDLDKCRDPETGIVEECALEIVSKLDTYTEISPSGTGLRIYARGQKPDRERSRRGRVEIYDGIQADGKPGGRFLTLTGHRLPNAPAEIRDRQEAITAVYHEHLTKPTQKKRKRKQSTEQRELHESNGQPNEAAAAFTAIAGDGDLDLLNSARARFGLKFIKLFDSGDISDYITEGKKDHSAADAGLIRHLFTAGAVTASRLDRLFRKSKLYRPKWDEKRGATTYGARTIKLILDTPDSPDGDKPNGDKPNGDKPASKEEPITMGDLALTVGVARRTDGGKLVVPVVLKRDGHTIDDFAISSSDSGLRNAVRRLTDHLPTDQRDTEAVRAVVARIIAAGSEQVANAGLASDGKTVRQIVADIVPERLDLKCRTKKGFYSSALDQEILETEFIRRVPTWLFAAVTEAVDAPKSPAGVLKEGQLQKLAKTGLEILAADLRERLPLVKDAGLGRSTARGREFWDAMLKVWSVQKFAIHVKVDVTTDGTVKDDVPCRVSLAQLVRKEMAKLGSVATGKWHIVRDGIRAWFRLTGNPVWPVLLAMHYDLLAQAREELPDVDSPESMNEAGQQFGIFDAEPPECAFTQRGKVRLSVLSEEFTIRVLEHEISDKETVDAAPSAEAVDAFNEASKLSTGTSKLSTGTDVPLTR